VNKYIPKVGEVFQVYNDTLDGWHSRSKAVLITDKQVVYLDDYGMTAAICLTRTFRPIQTKADVEREQLYGFFNDASNFGHSDEWLINKIQESSFTIPKKIKRSDIADAIYSSIGDVTDIQSKYAANKVCKLLGDLVEQDDKGGVE
jgi:hypothetical protein